MSLTVLHEWTDCGEVWSVRDGTPPFCGDPVICHGDNEIESGVLAREIARLAAENAALKEQTRQTSHGGAVATETPQFSDDYQRARTAFEECIRRAERGDIEALERLPALGNALFIAAIETARRHTRRAPTATRRA